MKKKIKKKVNKKKIKKILKANTKRFLIKFGWRMLSRICELAILFGIGYGLGLKLIRY